MHIKFTLQYAFVFQEQFVRVFELIPVHCIKKTINVIYKVPWELSLDTEVQPYINLWAQFANSLVQVITHTIQQKIYLYVQVLLIHFMVLSWV